MAGHIFVSPTEFTAPDGLPTVSVARTAPLPGAIFDWAAESLPKGTVSKWIDLTGSYTLSGTAVESQWPISTGSSVTFDGVNDRIDGTFPTGSGRTLVVVARATVVANSHRIFGSGTGSNPFHFGINSNGSRWIFDGGATIAGPTSKTPDTNWHVFVIALNGSSSVFAVDGEEWTGDTGAALGGSIRVGASASAYFGSEVKRIALLPRVANQAERNGLYSSMVAHYGL